MKENPGSFKEFLIDVLETTLIKHNKVESTGPRTWQVMTMILEACVWRFTGPGDPTIKEAKNILAETYPEIYKEYHEYLKRSNG